MLCKNDSHVLRIAPGSEAENIFVNKIMPVCKDKVVCRLGILFRLPWNEYVITHEDYKKCKKLIKTL